MTLPVLAVAGLQKRYGAKVVVDDVTFALQAGEIVGLLGGPGSGKTTTLHMLQGVLTPSAGTIEIDGIDLAQDRVHALARTNFAALYAPLPRNLTVRQHLRFFARLSGGPHVAARVEALLASFSLAPFRDAKLSALNAGALARTALAKAMLHAPKLLLLDEPTTSLDAASTSDVAAALRAFAESGRGTVLWASRDEALLRACCDRVIVLEGGHVAQRGRDDHALPAAE